MKCIILDDDRVFCIQLREILSKALATTDVSIETTFSGAVTHLRAANSNNTLPDLLFCDYRLHGHETGLDLLELLSNEQITVPSILLTDLDDPQVISRAGELGVPHITKASLIDSADFVRQLSLFAFKAWAEQRRSRERELQRQSENMLLLAAEIAHEFKHVMTATQTQVGRIRRQHRLDALTSDVLDKIFAQHTQKMQDGLRLSEILLTFGELKGRKPDFRSVELNTAVRQIVKSDDSASLLSIQLALHGEIPARIDIFLLTRLIAILLKNAVDHCPADTIVRVATGEMRHEGVRSVFVDIQDDGPGVLAQLRETIFEPGERAGKEIRYHDGSGLGLGLAFARVLAKLHGGSMISASIRCIEPTELHGANFRIVFPQE